MSEERHMSCIEASDSPCTPETCEEPICWVCEEPDPSWPCPTRRAQDAETAIKQARYIINSSILAAPDLTDWDKGWNRALEVIKQALEGALEDNDY